MPLSNSRIFVVAFFLSFLFCVYYRSPGVHEANILPFPLLVHSQFGKVRNGPQKGLLKYPLGLLAGAPPIAP